MSSKLLVRHHGLTWNEFKKEIYDRLGTVGVAPAPGTFIFRGQRSSSWGLVASFDRLSANLNPARRQAKYEMLLQNFSREVDLIGKTPIEVRGSGHSASPIAAYEVLGQHYGLPTRLLDWSVSPYVAAFFALFALSGPLDEFVGIWAIDCERLQSLIDSTNCSVNTTAAVVDRLIAQQGVFTHNRSIYTDLVELIENIRLTPDENSSKPILHQFTLSKHEASLARSDLVLMGIDQKALFPGVEGICNSLRENIMSELS